MTPFHFGSAGRRLFGIYDPARKVGGAERAALVCYPTGDEHSHAYRTLRQLATRISQTGTHVLRFDYYGTGDSSGETGEGDIAGWCSDIETAIAELKDMTGANRVSLIGLRLGANLAARTAATRANDIENLVLWDPLCAEDYPYVGSEGNHDPRHLDLSLFTASLPRRTLVLFTAQPPRSAEFGDLTVERLIDAPAWIEERTVSGTMPVDALHRIVDWLN